VSRVGKKIIDVPKGVQLSSDGQTVKVKGPKGENTWALPDGFKLEVADSTATILCDRRDRKASALHGLSRALVANMVRGVTEEFTRVLEIEGMGYKAELKGKSLELQIGYSHQVSFPMPAGVSARCDSPTRIVLSGIDKGLVGQTAANIRALRPPEPYKGKGIRYEGEVIRRKAGKTAGAA
jgi:large subunit ribosomal protein L6